MDKTSLEYAQDLINSCEFDPMNPFDISIDILDPMHGVNLEQCYFQIYKKWLEYEYFGENVAATCYEFLQESIFTGKHKKYFINLSSTQLENINNFFNLTIEEEHKHTEIWRLLVEKTFGYAEPIDSETTRNQCEHFINNNELVIILPNLYAGETITMSSCSLLYQYSTNPAKKEILKIFLTDESKHLNGFNQIMSEASKFTRPDQIENINKIYPQYNFLDFEFGYFGVNQVHKFIQNFEERSSAKKILMQSIFQNEWQKKYNKFITNKNFTFYKNLRPEISENEFKLIANKKWLEYTT